MKVLQILNYSAPYRGNFIDSLDMIEKNDIAEVENFYLFADETKTKSASWIDSINKDNKHVFYLEPGFSNSVKRIRKIVKDCNIDVIHMHFWGIRMHTAILIALWNIGGTKRPVLIRHFHNHSDYNEHPLRKIYGNIFYHSATMIGCSESVANSIKRDFPKVDVRCVNNAINFKRLDNYDEVKLGQGISVMMYGADFERKGVDIAYKAINNLINEGYQINLYIVCSINEDKCKDKLKKTAGTKTLPNWVCFLPPRQDIATYYRAIDIFASPSREEGFTYAIPEAAYCERNVIATKIGGQSYHEKIPEVIFIPAEDPEALSSAILSVVKKEKNREQVQDFLVKEYGLKKWANDVTEIYLEKMKERR